MELERLASAVRPRRSWEAIDLGFRLAQAWWWPVLRAWLLVAAPVFLLVLTLLWDSPQWIGLVLWWLKPLYERAPLEVLAQAQFGHVPGLRELARQWRRLVFRQALQALTVRRLSLSRSFKTPVMQLEGMAGAARRERLGMLAQGKSRSGAQWLTFVCMHLEAIFYLAGLGLLGLLLPSEVEIDWLALFTEDGLVFNRLNVVLLFLGYALVAPFYVAGGFALYLNRRTELEGWDIELAFRRLKKRLAAGPVLAALVLGLSLGLPTPPALAAEAAQPSAATKTELTYAQRRLEALDKLHPPSAEQKTARAAIKAVLDQPVFHRKQTIGQWKLRVPLKPAQPKKPPRFDLDWLKHLGGWLATGFEVLLWLALALLVWFIARRYPQWSQWLPRNARLRRREPAPDSVAGLDVRPESLPGDVAGAALQLAEAGEVRAALSLLYRASLLHVHALPLHTSHTEGEILNLVNDELPGAALLPYFARLTGSWQLAAYGHRLPDDAAQLCRAWCAAFGAAPESSGGQP